MADDAPRDASTDAGENGREAPAALPGGTGEHHPAAVVMVGVSAASLRSLERLLGAAPRGNGAAFVVAALHGEALDEDGLLDRLARWGGMPASFAADGTPLEPDELYFAPVGALTTVEDGHLCVRPAEPGAAGSGAIDTLAVSVAAEWKERSVLVVLAGLGSDGVLGTTATKERGGLTVAEAGEPSDGGNGGNGAGSIADFVLAVEAIPERITAHLQHLHALRAARGDAAAREEVSSQLARVAGVLRRRTGHDFHGYKHSTFLRRVQRRMQVAQVPDVDAYIAQLESSGDEIQHLFQDLLIGVTQFFRDRPEFELLEREVIPALFAGKGRDDTVRVWVLGCATGEEAYSIGILLREHMAGLDEPPQVQIFATDIDGRALASARAGRYSDAIQRDVTPQRLARWFTKEGTTYAVAKELREMCIFSAHNIIRDAPFSRMDLISCRNLLIYLNLDLQDRVVPLFHFSLRHGGVLFLGPSENITRQPHLFAPLDRRHRLFRRLEGVAALPDLPLTSGDRRRGERDATTGYNRRRPGDASLGHRADRAVERFLPAYVVVDEQFEALHFSGRTGRYLEPAPGTANLNLLSLVHRDLRLDLRTVLQRAVAGGRPARADWVQMGGDGDEGVLLNLVAEPVRAEQGEPQRYVVVFQELGPATARNAGLAGGSALRDEHVQRLEAELQLTKERLQAAIEELETSNEELKASNEEYQSINEELQSANEELETSKEELQSVNEELQTVNGELAARVGELGTANSDLRNVLDSTQIATVFLDNDLRVKSFTPASAELFHLIDSDLGRPIQHVVAQVDYPGLLDDVRRVLRTLGKVEREVGNPRTGAHYLARILPYRSLDNFIGGAVLSFLNITEVARAEQALRESEERFRMVARTVPVFLFTATPELGWDYANQRWYEVTGTPEGSALGDGWMASVHPDDLEESQRRWRGASETGEEVEQEFRVRAAGGAYRWFLVRSQPKLDGDGRIVRWFGSGSDIHERRMGEGRQRLLLAELQHRVKNILAVVRSVVVQTAETSGGRDDFVAHLTGRIGALARVQGILARTGEGAVSLEELLREELLAVGGNGGEQAYVEGPPVLLRGKAAEALALAVHELATNALKYGALSDAAGRTDVRWRTYAAGSDGSRTERLLLEWQESGVALDGLARRHGFGRELIEQGLPYELGATTALEFNAGGVRCVIDLPLGTPPSGRGLFPPPSGIPGSGPPIEVLRQ